MLQYINIMMKQETVKDYVCPVCLEYCTNTVETSCCNHYFCGKCANSSISHTCIYCRHKLPKLKSRPDIDQILDKLLVPCLNLGCKQEIIRKQLNNHSKTQCDFLKIICFVCSNVMFKSQYLKHLMTEHGQQLQSAVLEYPLIRNKLSAYQKMSEMNFQFDPLKQIVNKSGKLAKKGNTGKYYCGQSLTMAECTCDGNCGPNNGCCCVDCMKVELESRNIFQKGYLINYGSRLSKITDGIPYCGIRIEYNTENYCRVDNMCQDCQYLYEHCIERYRELYK